VPPLQVEITSERQCVKRRRRIEFRWADQADPVVLAVAAAPVTQLVIAQHRYCRPFDDVVSAGRFRVRSRCIDVIFGLGFGVVGTGLGVLLLDRSGVRPAVCVLHPVIASPTVPNAPASRVRRSMAPSVRG